MRKNNAMQYEGPLINIVAYQEKEQYHVTRHNEGAVIRSSQTLRDIDEVRKHFETRPPNGAKIISAPTKGFRKLNESEREELSDWLDSGKNPS